MIYNKILAVDTSSDTCSVALSESGILVGEIVVAKKNSHSEIISSCITNLLANCKIKIDEINAIAISAGPGSYTGLRIGYSIAKGITYSLNIPLLSIDTLVAMSKYVISHHLIEDSTILAPMLDARRMEVYTTLIEKNGNTLVRTSPIIIDENFLSLIPENRKIIFFGNGSKKCVDLMESNPNAQFLADINPRASFLFNYLSLASSESLYQAEHKKSPIYLKEFDNIIDC